jgi:hypothetical protein
MRSPAGFCIASAGGAREQGSREADVCGAVARLKCHAHVTVEHEAVNVGNR